jgi:cytochrome c biogenesis protein CcmG, thiol:disulfide interchange protein DsbE
MLARQVTRRDDRVGGCLGSTRALRHENAEGQVTKVLPQAFADRDSSARPDVCEAVDVRRALPFLAVAALVVVLVIGLTQADGGSGGEADAGPSLTELQRAVAGAPPPLAALYREGNRVVPSSVDDFRRRLRSLRGYPVVVNVWGSWCGPCKLEFPYFQRAVQRLGKRVAFLGIDVIDNTENAEEFLRSRPVPYPSLEDGDLSIAREVVPGARGAPHTAFYDANGKRVIVHQGQYESLEDLLADIEKYTGVA